MFVEFADNRLPATSHMAKGIITLLAGLLLVASLVNPAKAKPAFSTIAVDARTGKILYGKNIDARRYPASLTKMMTLYLLFEDLQAGRISLNTRLRVSRYAASRPPSKLGFKPGQTISVRNAILALVTKSANDVATAIAENLGGSEKRFAQRMTRTAHAIGMTRTTFANASGLPNRRQMTTARDMATLGLHLQHDFPQYYHFFSTRRFSYHRRAYGNHNRLLGRVEGVDGIKTGYTRASGYNLTTSTRRGKKRVVAVVMGARSGRSRNAYMKNLINRVFLKKRLSKGTRIAMTAGSPPGYRRRKNSFARVIRPKPPVPRQKPQIVKLAKAKTPDTTKIQDRLIIEKRPVSETPLSDDKNATFASAKMVDQVAELKSAKSDKLIPVKKLAMTIKAKTHSKSWNIQIGAFPNEESAIGHLAKAKRKASRNLSGKTPFTMEVVKGSSTIYRARYAGFNRNTARKTCRILSRKGIKCFALAPRS